MYLGHLPRLCGGEETVGDEPSPRSIHAVEPRVAASWLIMLKNAASKAVVHNFWKAGCALVLLASLVFLVGCQGVSAGAPNNSNPSNPQTGTLTLPATTFNFGSVAAGSSKTVATTVTNSGSVAVTVVSASVSSQYFSLVAPSPPVTISAGQSTPVSIQFSPNAAGTFNATLSITSNASNSPLSLTLSGTGTASGPAPGQLSLNPSSESFGNVTDATQQSETVTLTNSGGSTVDISAAAVSGTGFQLTGITPPLSLTASQSTTFTVTFAPQTAGAATGTVTITSDGANPSLTMALSGTGVTPGALGSSPTSLGFGSVTVGKNQTISETITNTGGTSDTISQVTVTGTGFTLSGITPPVTVPANQSVSFSVIFTPPAAATDTGSVTIASNGSNPSLAIQLSGTGTAAVGQLGISPNPLAVGSVVDGTSGTASGSLSATGANVTVSAVSSSSSAFSLSGLPTLPVTIPAGQSVPFTLTFSPQTTGAASGTLTVTSDAQSTTTTDTMTGTGTAAPTHTVSLSWTASSSSNISGYNVYRAAYTTACGSYSKINTTGLITGTTNTITYTDSVVTDGTDYCYAATAVNTSNEESGYSNVDSDVQIPPP